MRNRSPRQDRWNRVAERKSIRAKHGQLRYGSDMTGGFGLSQLLC